jgi:hypothetical protein
MSEFTTVDVELRKYAAQYGISEEMLSLSAERDEIMGMTVVRLVRHVAAIKADDALVLPATWVDAMKAAEVKRSPIMRWIVRRWPIQYRTYRAIEYLPNLSVAVGKYRGPIRLMDWDGRD